MCGLVGCASTEGMKNRSERLQFMKMGLDIDSWRGWESTGIAMVPNIKAANPLVYKRALNGRDFIQLRAVDKLFNDIEKFPVVIGHNRAATTGRGNIVDENAHPFQYGKITLVHNGHIRNTHELPGAVALAQSPVDSAVVAAAMELNGEQATLEQAEGGFCFIWWNAETEKLSIARNTERPLHMAFVEKENSFYWASEVTQLLHFMKDMRIDEDVGILYPKPWTWYQFSLDNLREYTKTPFTQRQGRQTMTKAGSSTHTSGGSDVSGSGWTEADWEAWAEANATQASIDSTSKIADIEKEINEQRLKDAKGQNGIPTSKKRIERAKQELGKLGYTFKQMRATTPISWTKYKNQDSLGSVIARIRSGGHLVEILQVRHADYLRYSKRGIIIADLVNVRNGPAREKLVVGVVSNKMEGFLSRRESKEQSVIQESHGGSIARDYTGPGDQKISLARFLELTVNGCAHCQADILVDSHKDLVWIGEPPGPICVECSTDPGIMELIGFPQYLKRAVN